MAKMDGHWQWTSYGWEKGQADGSNKSSGRKDLETRFISDDFAEQIHSLPSGKIAASKSTCSAVIMGNGRLGALNARARQKQRLSMDSGNSRFGHARLSQRVNDLRNERCEESDSVLDDTNPDQMTELCLSTSVIPGILLHERLRESLTKDASRSYSSVSSFRYDDRDSSVHHPHGDSMLLGDSYRFDPLKRSDMCSDGLGTKETVHRNDIDSLNKSLQLQSDWKPPVISAETHQEMAFLDDLDLNDKNLVDDLLKEVSVVDDIEQSRNCSLLAELNESFKDDLETETERMKRQLSLMGKDILIER